MSLMQHRSRTGMRPAVRIPSPDGLRAAVRLSLVVPALLTAALLGPACDGNGTGSGDLARADAQSSRLSRRFTDDDLNNLLLPAGAVPVSLKPSSPYPLTNDEVARFFPDVESARRTLDRYGRVQGAGIDYDLVSAPRAQEPAVRVSSSVAWYSTPAGAEAVLNDPSMELVLHRFGLVVGEIKADKLGDGTRVFRGYRSGDAPDRAAYLVLFRRENLINAVVVVVPAATDDGGTLAISLARRQSILPLPPGPAQ